MCRDVGAEVCIFPNEPLGRKKIAGLNFAHRNFEFDYLMELGSDDLVNPEIFELYKPYMEKKFEFFGLNNLYYTNWDTRETIFCKDYNEGQTFGAGRMILNDAIRVHPWPEDCNSGLDTAMVKILASKGIMEHVIDCGEKPYILDIKTNTTINHWIIVEKSRTKIVQFNDICHYFGLPTYNGLLNEIQSFDGFESFYWHFRVHLKRSDAYEEAEKIHLSVLGRRKYKNYSSFSRILRRKYAKG
jgi:hypothetical protein